MLYGAFDEDIPRISFQLGVVITGKVSNVGFADLDSFWNIRFNLITWVTFSLDSLCEMAQTDML